MEKLSMLLALYDENPSVALQRARNVELWWWSEYVEQTVEWPEIWAAIMWLHFNVELMKNTPWLTLIGEL